MSTLDLSHRVTQLETRVRILTLIAGLTTLTLVTIIGLAWKVPTQPDVLRARALIIEDHNGTERIVIGAPIPEPPGRIAPSTGMVIKDSASVERFGVGLLGNGNMIMGFDAPLRPGDHNNRERINIAVNSLGRGQLRFLDNTGGVRTHMELFDDDNVRLFFTDYQSDKTVVHRVDAHGDSVIVHPK
jgi:hypothetical protein